jgi:hypothetical protein
MIQNLQLTEAQRAQAQEIIDRWEPKLESSLANVANPRAEGLLGPDRHFGESVDPSTWPASAIGVVTFAGFSRLFQYLKEFGAELRPSVRFS